MKMIMRKAMMVMRMMNECVMVVMVLANVTEEASQASLTVLAPSPTDPQQRPDYSNQ